MNIKQILLLTIASLTITIGLFADKSKTPTQENKPELSIQDIFEKLKNKELTIGTMVSYEKTDYKITRFEERITTESVYNHETDSYSSVNCKKMYIRLTKIVTWFGIKMAEFRTRFLIKEDMEAPINTHKRIIVPGTAAGLMTASLGILAYAGAKGIAYWQSKK